MKNKRRLLFRVVTLLIIVAIAAWMMVIGRGHTVYLDNLTQNYQGTSYEAPYKIKAFVDGEKVATLNEGDRGMATCIGQTFKVTLEITEHKGDAESTAEYTIELPYDMDGIVVNLPGYLAGLPEETWMSEFISKVADEPAEEEVPSSDEFTVSDF